MCKHALPALNPKSDPIRSGQLHRKTSLLLVVNPIGMLQMTRLDNLRAIRHHPRLLHGQKQCTHGHARPCVRALRSRSQTSLTRGYLHDMLDSIGGVALLRHNSCNLSDIDVTVLFLSKHKRWRGESRTSTPCTRASANGRREVFAPRVGKTEIRSLLRTSNANPNCHSSENPRGRSQISSRMEYRPSR